MNNKKHNYTGGYHGRNVKFSITGEPVWKVNCYCNWCQTTSGAFRSFVLFDEKYIKLSGKILSHTKTAIQLTEYR